MNGEENKRRMNVEGVFKGVIEERVTFNLNKHTLRSSK